MVAELARARITCPQCGRWFDLTSAEVQRVLVGKDTPDAEAATVCSPPCAARWRAEAE